MKLEHYQYKISARAEGRSYRVYAEAPDGKGHEFMVNHAGPMFIVFSPEISDMYEASLYDEAEELRIKLSSIFRTHYSAIKSATRKTTDMVDINIL